MFCGNCGSGLPDTALFCTSCGARVPQEALTAQRGAAPPAAGPAQGGCVPPAAGVPAAGPRKKRKRIGLIAGIATVAVVAVLAVLVLPPLLVQKTNSTVDASGGTVTMGDMEMTFGSGAVDKPTGVSVTSSNPSGDKKPDGLLTPLYVVDMDNACTNPVAVKFKLPVSAPEDGVMLGLGAEITGPDGKATVSYRYIEAAASDGYITADIVPVDYATEANGGAAPSGIITTAKAAGRNLRVYVGIFECSAWFKDDGHFKITYPGSASFSSAEALLGDLEEIYQFYLDEGFNYSRRTIWPFQVNIVANNDLGDYVESGFWNAAGGGRDPDNGWIDVQKELFMGGYQQDNLKPILAHEMFHFVQANFETNGVQSFWFDDATATYEKVFRKATPNIVLEYQMDIFDGVFPAEDTMPGGYAREPMIEFLVGKYGKEFIVFTYDSFDSGTPVKDAIIDATADPSEWAADMYQSVVADKSGWMTPFMTYSYISKGDAEYSKIGAPMPLEKPTEDEISEAAKNGEPVTVSQGSVSIPALGARLLAVTVDPELQKMLTDGMSLRFKNAGSGDMRLFVLNGTDYKVLLSKDGVIQVPDLKGELAKGTQYLLLMTSLLDAGTESYSVSADLQMCPTLDELVGTFDDGQTLISDVFISQGIRDQAAAAAQAAQDSESGELSELGCDLNLISQLDQMKGQTYPELITIEKTGEDTGNLILQNEDGEPSSVPFTYENGLLSIDYTMSASSDTVVSASQMSGELNAAYGKNNDVTISGKLTCTIPGYEDDFYIEFTLTGSHPLPVKP
jgi:hypothetical protein